MTNINLIKDYISRAAHRFEALKVLFERESFADVVRESQEIVELCLKALLRKSGIEAPRTHDVGETLLSYRDNIEEKYRGDVEKMAKISHNLRRDRELSFYGSEDLTPSEFYTKEDATEAFHSAQWLVQLLKDL